MLMRNLCLPGLPKWFFYNKGFEATAVLYGRPTLKCQGYLHISLSTTIFNNTNGIIHSLGHSGSHNNLRTVIRRDLSCEGIPVYFIASVACSSCYFNIYPKIPYDNVALSVKRIDTFRIGGHVLLFSKLPWWELTGADTMATVPSVGGNGTSRPTVFIN